MTSFSKPAVRSRREDLGRRHTPGSTLGWHLIEANDLTLVAQHVGEWADVLAFEVYPVIEDAEAGAAAKKLFGG